MKTTKKQKDPKPCFHTFIAPGQGVKWYTHENVEAKPEPAPECILAEAARVTTGDRQAQYGPPDQDFQRIAQMWSAIKGVPFEAREVALFMILVKVSRETHQRKRDNWVDIAGYARCGSICREGAA